MTVLEGAEEFSHHDGASAAGVLFCHGFTGTPMSLRPWAQEVAANGYHVELPRLPGHGTTWQDMNGSSWQQWYSTVDDAFGRLRERCGTVFVAGLSMGGALALRLAEQHGPRISGLVLVNPFVRMSDPRLALLPVLRRVTGSVKGIASDIKKPDTVELAYDRTPLHALSSMLVMCSGVVRELNTVDQPLLVLRSTIDHVVPADNGPLILSRVASRDVTEIMLEDSYHVATLDHDAERIVKESLAFFHRLAGVSSHE